jgi:hypothetical protein
VAVPSHPVRSARRRRHRRPSSAGPRAAHHRSHDWDTTATRASDPEPTLPAPPVRARDSSGGDRLLIVFTAATLIMVVAIVAVGAVDRAWVLVPVMVIDLVVAFAVTATLVGLMRDDGGPSA